MAKDRDWLDYVNLASQVGQNAQLGDVQSKLGAIGAIALQQEVRQQQEAEARNREDVIRDSIFQSGQMLKWLREHTAENPRGALAISLGIKNEFDKNEITTRRLTSFEDKERLQKLFDDLSAFRDECAGRLAPEDREKAEKCAKYQSEQPELEELIRWLKDKESLTAAISNLRIMEVKRTPTNGVLAIGVVGMILLAGGVGSMILTDGFESTLKWIITGLGFVLTMGSMFAAGREVCPVTNADYNAFKRREDEEKKLKAEVWRKTEHFQLMEPRLNALLEKFGRHDKSAQYENMLEERKALVREVISESTRKD